MDDRNAELPEDIMIFDEGFDFIDITLKDVCDQLSCVDTSQSYGPDNISPNVVRDGGIVPAESLCKLYKMSNRLCKIAKTMETCNYCPNPQQGV